MATRFDFKCWAAHEGRGVTDVELRAELQVTRAELAALAARVAELEASRRAAADVDGAQLLRAIAGAVHDNVFSAREVFRHGGVGADESLRQVLAAAGIRSPKQLGKRFRKLEGRACSGLQLARLGVDRDGVIWRLVVRE